MNYLQYKGYVGSTEVSVEDGVVFGKLLFIRDLVTYESETPAGLKSAFEDAVDDYLSECQAEGREPDRPFKGQFNVRVSSDLHRSLAITASQKGVTLNEYVQTVLGCHEHVDAHGNVRRIPEELVVVLRDRGQPQIFAVQSQVKSGQAKGALRPKHDESAPQRGEKSPFLWAGEEPTMLN